MGGRNQDAPIDPAPAQRALAALVADGLGLALTTVGRMTGLGALPIELASAVTAVDTVPRLQEAAEDLLGTRRADTTIALANAGAQGLAQAFLGLAVDAVYRVLTLREANANADAWRQRQDQYLATPERAAAAPVAVNRPTPLARGPVEQWGDTAGLLSPPSPRGCRSWSPPPSSWRPAGCPGSGRWCATHGRSRPSAARTSSASTRPERLTEGRIAVGAIASPDGPPVSLDRLTPALRTVLAAGLRATPPAVEGRLLAHLTDRAVSQAGELADVRPTTAMDGWQRVAALPFEPSRGFHATLGRSGLVGVLSVKGAPEVVLPRCTAVRRDLRDAPLDRRERRQLTRQVETLAGLGYRVLAVAERTAQATRGVVEDGDVHGLTLLGYLALTDPVRTAAATSLDALRRAGVQIVMITGDHPGTAASIARRLDLLDGRVVVTGAELDSLSDDALARRLPTVAVVARGTPAHKVRVVQAFQRLGRTVAMTGDGANDAPAIRLADVGNARTTRHPCRPGRRRPRGHRRPARDDHRGARGGASDVGVGPQGARDPRGGQPR